ncbi:MAG: hypothetical protein ACPG7U_00430 [Holosporaceae bacterium]
MFKRYGTLFCTLIVCTSLSLTPYSLSARSLSFLAKDARPLAACATKPFEKTQAVTLPGEDRNVLKANDVTEAPSVVTQKSAWKKGLKYAAIGTAVVVTCVALCVAAYYGLPFYGTQEATPSPSTSFSFEEPDLSWDFGWSGLSDMADGPQEGFHKSLAPTPNPVDVFLAEKAQGVFSGEDELMDLLNHAQHLAQQVTGVIVPEAASCGAENTKASLTDLGNELDSLLDTMLDNARTLTTS